MSLDRGRELKMAFGSGYDHVLGICLPFIIAVLLAGKLEGRDVRPSDHGLIYQPATSGGGKSPQMMAFFGASRSPEVALPEAKNSSDTTSWWAGEQRRKGHDHVKSVLLVASLACGITGVALFLVSAFLYVFQFRKQSSSSTNNMK